jgi:hypothetical protein
VKIIDPDGRHIDYCRALTNRFALRVRADLVLTIIELGEAQPKTISKEFATPVELENLPSYVRLLVDDHRLNCPGSDLLEVLTGAKSFQEALEAPTRIEVKSMAANRSEYLPVAS